MQTGRILLPGNCFLCKFQMQEQFFRKFWFFDGDTDSTS
uniref:Uncharacterized protein n=1 Tax=Leptospira santarosai serovar Arenal str. MAVJ 401 TaxID=1049976 RepID=M6K3I2_9LEPT|nr:hypothetical protein LEP1GSC063_2381 [Leptospira santarosai serovar Arenal str. MAVJ 401]